MQGYEYLDKLTKEEQVQFCRARVNHKRAMDTDDIATYLMRDFADFGEFIDQAFVWINTPEGHDYWSEIYNRW